MAAESIPDFSPSLAGKFRNAAQILQDAVESRVFPGAVCAIGHRDELAVLPVGKLSYAEDAAAVTAETIYDLASLTKVVATTTAVMLLVERGAMALDSEVAAYLPQFIAPNDNGPDRFEVARSHVLVRHLLAHSSGLPAYEKFYLRAREKQHVIEEAMAMPLEALPGQRTLYSDLGFILLGEIVERVSKTPLDRFAQREIFDPLDMRQTCFNPPQEWRERIAPTELDESFRKRLLWGEVHDENAWVMGGVAGHAGLFGTAGDLARFCRMMLREGRTDGAPLIRPETIQEFTRSWPASEGAPRALGWDRPSWPYSSSGRRFSPASYGHLGFTGTSIWIDPQQSLFVILLSNRVHPTRANDAIKKLRPAVHDAVVEAIAV